MSEALKCSEKQCNSKEQILGRSDSNIVVKDKLQPNSAKNIMNNEQEYKVASNKVKDDPVPC